MRARGFRALPGFREYGIRALPGFRGYGTRDSGLGSWFSWTMLDQLNSSCLLDQLDRCWMVSWSGSWICWSGSWILGRSEAPIWTPYRVLRSGLTSVSACVLEFGIGELARLVDLAIVDLVSALHLDPYAGFAAGRDRHHFADGGLVAEGEFECLAAWDEPGSVALQSRLAVRPAQSLDGQLERLWGEIYVFRMVR